MASTGVWNRRGSRRPPSRSRWVIVSICAVALAVPTLALGAAKKKRPSYEDLERRVRELEEIVRTRLPPPPPGGVPAAPAAEAKPPVPPSEIEKIVDERLKKQKVLAGWKDGFFLESPDNDFKLRVGGFLQADSHFFPTETGGTGTDSFTMRRVRPILEGTVGQYFGFMVKPDFGQGKTVLKDAFVELKYWPELRFKAGKYKDPLSLERLEPAEKLLFVERSVANNLTPDRDIGVEILGDLWNGALSYQGGVFNGNLDGADNDGAVGSDKSGVTRVFVQPFRNEPWPYLQKLGIGVGGMFGNRDKVDTSGLAYKTGGRETFFQFKKNVVNDGFQTRVAPQGYYFWGPFSLMGEYIRTDQPSSLTVPPKKTPGKPTVPGMFFQDDVSNRGWLVQTSYVLTGDDAAYDGVQPRNPFDPRAGRWGAVEVAYRYSELNIDPTVYTSGLADRTMTAGSATEHTFGVNWYFNKYVKLMLDYEHTGFDQAAPFTTTTFSGKKRTHEDAILSRVQLQF